MIPTLDILRAAVAELGHAETARRLRVAEASVYRWLRLNTPPSQRRVLRAVASLGKRFPGGAP